MPFKKTKSYIFQKVKFKIAIYIIENIKLLLSKKQNIIFGRITFILMSLKSFKKLYSLYLRDDKMIGLWRKILFSQPLTFQERKVKSDFLNYNFEIQWMTAAAVADKIWALNFLWKNVFLISISEETFQNLEFKNLKKVSIYNI